MILHFRPADWEKVGGLAQRGFRLGQGVTVTEHNCSFMVSYITEHNCSCSVVHVHGSKLEGLSEWMEEKRKCAC